MKKIIIFLFFSSLISLELFCQDFNCKDENSFIKCSHALTKNNAIQYRENLNTSNYDILYHKLKFEVDPAVRYIKGSVLSHFKFTNGKNDEISFDLSQNMIVDSVIYKKSKINFTTNNDLLTIALPVPVGYGKIDSLTIFYQGEPPSNGFGSFETGTHNNSPILWTLSEPYGSRDWWPNKMSLLDKIDSIDVFITTPESYKAASNGLLIDTKTSNSNKTYHWIHRYPIASYLVAIAVTDYTTYSNYVPMQDGTQLEVLNYVYPESLDDAQNNTPNIIPIIQLFNQLTIPYPFAKEKYGHAQFGWGGGMEHQTMTFVKNFGFGLIAHECAHQWFGDHITCGSWEDIWLNEGFATYFEGLCQQNINPGNWYNWRTGKIASITSNVGGSVQVDDTTSVNRIFSSRLTYNKGAYLLHMLRWTLGDEEFFGAIKNYLKDTKLAGGFAKTPDLIAAFENKSGKNLTKFFDQWYYNQGYPIYDLKLSQEGAGNNKKLIIYQTQSHPSVDFFEMAVPVQFFINGKDTILRFDHNFSGESFNVNLVGKIDSIKFDPELWLISKNNSITVSTSDIKENVLDFEIYPNPGDNGFYITSTSDPIEVISIWDATGKQIRNIQSGLKGDFVNTDSLPCGSYFILIQTKKGIFSQKWLKK